MTITLEIDKEQDLPKMLSKLDELGWNYHLNDEEFDEWGGLPEAAIEGIKEGLADIEAGRVHSHEDVMNLIHEKLNSLK